MVNLLFSKRTPVIVLVALMPVAVWCADPAAPRPVLSFQVCVWMIAAFNLGGASGALKRLE